MSETLTIRSRSALQRAGGKFYRGGSMCDTPLSSWKQALANDPDCFVLIEGPGDDVRPLEKRPSPEETLRRAGL